MEKSIFKRLRTTSINKINIIAIVFAGIFAFVAAFVVIFNEFREFNADVVKIENTYMQQQQQKAVRETTRLLNLLEYRYKNFVSQSQEDIYASLAAEIKIIFENFDDGSYIFVSDANKNIIYLSRQIKLDDAVLTELLHTAKMGGGFYSFESNKQKTNLVYVKEFWPAQLIVGSGVSLDEIDKVLAQKKEEHNQKISGFILKIVTLTLFLYLASILKYRYTSEKIRKEIKYISESFKNASANYTAIDLDKIKFQEFKEISEHANLMLIAAREKKLALEDLNINLELKVSEKTQELQKSLEYGKELLKNQDKFLKNAIHEINTPLSIILMNLDLYNLKHEKNPYLLKIEAGVKVLQNIYNDLSFVIKKDRVNHTLSMINFSEFIKSRIDYFQDVALGNHLLIKGDIEDGIFVVFNEDELQRICDNNISNAIKYSYINETILVRLHTKDKYSVLEIESRGDTIEAPEKLFLRFYREDIARGGFGLGLNIVKEICDKNGVNVEVISSQNVNIFRYHFECSRRID